MPTRREVTQNGGAPVPREMTKREGRQLFERKVKETTGLTSKQFIEKWQKGQLPDTSENVRLSMMIPLAR